ncbi:MAG: hypothetical protein GEU97_06960 [Actinophytocola sp.]|nr:hypothetical protein [Actinophytocola sp.]
MAEVDVLAEARDAYHRRDWDTALRGFAAARDQGELPPDDVLAQSAAAWWLGRVEEALAAGEEAYRRYLHGQRPRQARW